MWRAFLHQQVLSREYMLPGVSRMSPYGSSWLAATNPMDVTAALEHSCLHANGGDALSAGVPQD